MGKLYLNDDKPRYWAPNDKIINHLCTKYESCEKVLEVGPGGRPLRISTDFIDWNSKEPNCIQIDLDTQPFPYKTNSFDFLYSRHVLEDIQNPDFAFSEMIRVAKEGFIETPSPLVEMTKNIDADLATRMYSGYIHHRYIIWTELDTNTLCFLPKYPIVDICEHKSTERLTYLDTGFYWNNYYHWSPSKLPNIKMYKNGVNFDIQKHYTILLDRAITKSLEHTSHLVREFN